MAKIKCVIFRNGKNLRKSYKWYFNGDEVEVVDQFCYLGILLNYNGKFFMTQKRIASQCSKALFSLKRNLQVYTPQL